MQRSNSPLPGHDAQSNARGMPGRGGDVEVSNWLAHKMNNANYYDLETNDL